MSDDKRFDATPSRLARAKREGNVARSQDLGAVAAFAGATSHAVRRADVAGRRRARSLYLQRCSNRRASAAACDCVRRRFGPAVCRHRRFRSPASLWPRSAAAWARRTSRHEPSCCAGPQPSLAKLDVFKGLARIFGPRRAARRRQGDVRFRCRRRRAGSRAHGSFAPALGALAPSAGVARLASGAKRSWRPQSSSRSRSAAATRWSNAINGSGGCA